MTLERAHGLERTLKTGKFLSLEQTGQFLTGTDWGISLTGIDPWLNPGAGSWAGEDSEDWGISLTGTDWGISLTGIDLWLNPGAGSGAGEDSGAAEMVLMFRDVDGLAAGLGLVRA
ncbi:unnamed protein product [Leuciscus chuanchicus]